MKRILLFLFPVFVALVFFSCKKESSGPPSKSAKLYKVTFTAGSNFSQKINSAGGKQINSLTTSSDTVPIAGYSTVLEVKIYNSKNILVRQYIQNAGVDSNYGTIVDSLAAGTYTVMMAAGQNGLFVTPQNSYDVIYYLPQVSGRAFGSFSDTFFSQFQFTVSNGPVNKNVVLSRIVGKLEVDFTDMIPQNAARVDMNVNKEDFEFLSNGQLAVPDTITYHFAVPTAAKGTNTYSISQLVLNTATPFTVILTAYDSSNTVIATHTVTNVTCHQNERTILTGNFSNATTNSNPGFSITVDPNWGAPSIVHY